MLDSSTLSKDGNNQISQKSSSRSIMEDLFPCYKILILGDPGIGKTSLIHRYISNEFLEKTISTMGLDYQNKIVDITSDDKIILKLWDTAGSEKYNSIAKNYFTNCDGIILCFDITDIKTFNNLNNWINYINDYVKIIENKEDEEEEEEEIEDNKVVIKWLDDNEKEKPIIVLTGTKSDTEGEKVDTEEIDKLKNNLKCKYFETSSKNGDGIENLFLFIAKELFKKNQNKNHSKRKGGFKLKNKRINDEDENAENDGYSQSKLQCF